ncbi:unnamed protein product [Onchocerca flexuosa]|uniref:Ion_trans_2 domain-containing protein n=1 Tax=Onchocerca flexuosa TaxID=387005 RepID=A0A183H7V8_9BILA|nr:unnamed protein product [Onchocerca flexuosa]
MICNRTIGFGDIVPGQSLGEGSQEKLIVCALYLLFGMALIAMCFKLMQDDVVRKARWLGQKIGILAQESLSDSEFEMDDDNLIEDEDDDVMSEERIDQDKPTLSSGSSRYDGDELRNLIIRDEKKFQYRKISNTDRVSCKNYLDCPRHL